MGHGPLNIAAAPGGSLWFSEAAASSVGTSTLSGVISETSGLSGVTSGIAVAPEGDVWMTEYTAGLIDPASHPSRGSARHAAGWDVRPDRPGVRDRALLLREPGGARLRPLLPTGCAIAATNGSVTLTFATPQGLETGTFSGGTFQIFQNASGFVEITLVTQPLARAPAVQQLASRRARRPRTCWPQSTRAATACAVATA
jgi:hypothetical protein